MIAFSGMGSDADRDDAQEAARLNEDEAFVRGGADPATVTRAEVIVNPGNTVVQGTMIQAVTETALDSTLPGAIRAIVSEDVHSFDGTRVLIPRGARLIGRYRSDVALAQSRVMVAWDRIILPDNQTVEISAFGGDELGRTGTTGFVDTRFAQRFGSAALISLIGALPCRCRRPDRRRGGGRCRKRCRSRSWRQHPKRDAGLSRDPPRDPCGSGRARSRSWSTATWRFSDMAASYLEASLDRLGAPVQRDDTIEICINPDGQVWGEFQGDHFMRSLGMPLTQTEIKDLGNQIASAASTTLSTKKPIVSVSILYRDRPIRAQVIQPPAVEGGFSIIAAVLLVPAARGDPARLPLWQGTQSRRPAPRTERRAARCGGLRRHRRRAARSASRTSST